jgi:hypothetical protein
MCCPRVLPFVFFALTASLLAQSNPIPFLNQPLVPTAVAPGSPEFTLTVNGTGFVSGAVVKWNGAPLATSFVSYSRLMAAVPAASIATASTVNVTVTNPAPGGGTSSSVLFTITLPTSSLTFSTSVLNVGATPGAVVTGDFNNDGKTDLAVLNLNQPDSCYQNGGVGTLQILLGNGAGGFSTASNTCFQESGINIVGFPFLVAEDFDGNGNLGLAAESYADGVSALLIYPGNGDGTLSESDVEPLSDEPKTIIPAFADFNGDGHLDFSFTQTDDDFPGIFVYLGNGNGTFTCCYGGDLSYPAGTGVFAGDFNGDGILDLAIINYDADVQTGPITPLGIVLGVGGGFFSEAANQPSTTLVDPGSAVTADFNGDGILDLAFAPSGSTGLTILKGNGDGTFTQLNSEPTLGCSGSSVAVADLNGDGKLDLVRVGGANTIEIFLGNGDGTFQTGFTETVGNAPQSVVIGDFNADGRLDIAVANSADNTVTILLQTGASTTVVSSSANPTAYQQPIALSATVTAAYGGSATDTVTFFDGINSLGTASVNNNVANLTGIVLATGEHTITASYSGGNGVLGGTSAPLTEIVNPATTSTSLISSANPIAPNQSVTYTATVASQYGGATTGTVSFKDGKVAVIVPLSGGTSTLTETYSSGGTQSVTATYSGDGNNASSTAATLMEYVESLPVKTTTIVTTSGSPSVVNQSVTFTASVSSTYGAIPDGEMVTFYDGITQIGTGTTARGVAIFTTSAMAVKTHNIKCSYAGDATFKTSSGTVPQIVQAYTTATALSASPNPSNYGDVVVLTAVVTTSGSRVSTGNVTFESGTTTLGTGTLNATGTATLSPTQLPVGSDSLTASYKGDSLNGKSTSSVLAQTVNPAQLTMMLTSSPNPSAAGKSVKFTAALISSGSLPNGQQVTFSYNGTTIGTATISGGKASFSTTALPAGSDVVTASFAGNANYGSTLTSVTQTVN